MDGRALRYPKNELLFQLSASWQLVRVQRRVAV